MIVDFIKYKKQLIEKSSLKIKKESIEDFIESLCVNPSLDYVNSVNLKPKLPQA